MDDKQLGADLAELIAQLSVPLGSAAAAAAVGQKGGGGKKGASASAPSADVENEDLRMELLAELGYLCAIRGDHANEDRIRVMLSAPPHSPSCSQISYC